MDNLNSGGSSMDPWSASIMAGGAIAGSTIGALSAKKPSSSTHLAKLNLKYGKLYDEWTAKNMPAYNRAGMEAAGFNPILAITNGQQAHGMANTPGHGAWDASGGAGQMLSEGINSAVSAYYDNAQKAQNLENMKSQKDVLDTQAKLNEKREDKLQWDMDNPAGYWQNVRRGFNEIGDAIGKGWSWLKGGSGSSAKDVKKDVKRVHKVQNNYNIHYHNDGYHSPDGRYSVPLFIGR